MNTSEKYTSVLDALETLRTSELSSVDKSTVEELINSVYKDVITTGTLTCSPTNVQYTFQDGTKLQFVRGGGVI